MKQFVFSTICICIFAFCCFADTGTSDINVQLLNAANETTLQMVKLVLFIAAMIISWLLAKQKGYNPWLWFLAGGGIIGIIILFCMQSAKESNMDDEKRAKQRLTGNIVGGILSGLVIIIGLIVPIIISIVLVNNINH